MKKNLLYIISVLCLLSMSHISYAQDTDGDGTANNLDLDEDNDGIPDELDGCSTIDIANTIGIGSSVVNNSLYSIDETTIQYLVNTSNVFYGYVAGNQGDAIRVEGPTPNGQLELNFSKPIQSVTFKITDFDDNEEVTVNAYDQFNNLINLSANNVPFLGTFVARTGNLIHGTSSGTNSEGDDDAEDITGAAYLYFPGEVSRIVFDAYIEYNSSLRITELNYCLKDSDGDSVLDFLDIDSDNDGIPDTIEAGGVDTDGDGYIDNIADNNGNGIPDIYDFRCTNGLAASGYAIAIDNNDTSNTVNQNDALNAGDLNYAEINSGGTLALRFADLIPAGNNIVVRHEAFSGSTPISFTIERSENGTSYSNAKTFTTGFNGTYEVLSYDLIGGNTRYIKITNLSTETLAIDYAKYNFGANSDCSGINGQQILNLDTDNDGLTNAQDLDSDGDGIFDIIEANSIDSDGNGLADGYLDSDGDGFNDNYDGDVGNDGIAENSASAFITTGADTDSDGIPNSYNNADADSSGFPNPYDIDADDDGIPDNIEAQTTSGYIIPAAAVNSFTGINNAYPTSLSLIDTDGDGIFDYLDSDTDGDGTPDIQENGDGNLLSNLDTDLDGLDDNFDSNNVTFDVNDEVSIGDLTDLTNSFGDVDGDLPLGGDLDYRDVFDINPPASATIDFDGVDDYVEVSTSLINTLDTFTLSFWIKPELIPSGTDRQFVIGQKDMFDIDIALSGTDPYIYIHHWYNSGATSQGAGTQISSQDWTHITVSANYLTKQMLLYKNGVPIVILSFSTSSKEPNANPFRIGSKEDTQPSIGNNFNGWMDEIRLFDIELTADQIQQMVYQEIEQNAGSVHGSVINKDIVNVSTNTTIPWANLVAYYPMTNILDGRIIDESDIPHNGKLYNITTLLPQTAPMPYETVSDGDWTQEATWLHGDVWDIEDVANNKDWSIVQIHDKVTTANSHTQLGMFIDANNSLTVTGDNSIHNSWYLELNGTLDLQNDSQLIQGIHSDLVTSTTGKILRRQEGTLNYYWYNYWSSPVGTTAVTNNLNTNFSIDMLKDDTGNSVTFTNNFDNPGDISTVWLYKFQNGITYWDWVSLTPSTIIEPGVGFAHKGTQNTDGEKQYIFEGKPNNGTIILTGDDVDNDESGVGESVDDVTFTSYLVGNPYPSALDTGEFIRDNIDFDNGQANPIINGTIYVWEQWAGNNHMLENYEGGYATINLSTTAPAYQWNDATTQSLTLPTFYIPVAQGFFVEVINDGDIVFNNNQRIFIKESDANGNPNNGSVFFRTSEESSTSDESDYTNDQMGIIRLNLNVSNGNQRNFVLAFSDFTSDDFDYGYDSRTIDPQADDMGSYFTQNDEKMIIQSFSPITDDKVVDLILTSSGNYNYSIEIDELINIPQDQDIYLRDNLTNTYFDLRSGAYTFTTDVVGEDSERFDVVFQSDSTLSNQEFLADNTIIYVNNIDETLFVKNLPSKAKLLTITNVLGQTINSYNNVYTQELENGLDISNLSAGLYIVSVKTENNLTIDKKIIID